MSCIYKIVNKVNGKMYIGSTNNTLKKRASEHKAYLRKNKHYNQYLQNSWNKYGEESFIFNIIDICDTNGQELLELELSYIKALNPEYNLCKETKGGKLGRVWTIEQRNKISVAKKGSKHSEESKIKIKEARSTQIITDTHKRRISNTLRSKSKIIIEAYKDNKLVESCNSVSSLARKLGIERSCIFHNLSGKSKTSFGFTFKRKEV